MRLKYDTISGAFTLYFNENKVVRSEMITDDCILKFDAESNVIAIEMLDAPGHDIDFTHVEMIDVSDPAYQARIIEQIKRRSDHPIND